jgi:hypothetical protein
MRPGDDPLQNAIRDHWKLVDVVAGHESKCIQHLRVRSNHVQLFDWSHGPAHCRAFPMVARDGANVPQSNEAHQAPTVLDGEAALAGLQEAGVNKILQTHTAVHDGAAV